MWLSATSHGIAVNNIGLYLDLKLTKSDLLIKHTKKTYYSLNHSIPRK